MSKKEIQHIAQLLNSLDGLGCDIDTDEDGQIIVYTNCKYADDDTIVAIEEGE